MTKCNLVNVIYQSKLLSTVRFYPIHSVKSDWAGQEAIQVHFAKPDPLRPRSEASKRRMSEEGGI